MTDAKLIGKGYQLLALFNIEYHRSSEPITQLLMENPNSEFRLEITRIRKIKKKVKKP